MRYETRCKSVSGLKSQYSDLKKETQEDEAIRWLIRTGCEIVRNYGLRFTNEENPKL